MRSIGDYDAFVTLLCSCTSWPLAEQTSSTLQQVATVRSVASNLLN